MYGDWGVGAIEKSVLYAYGVLLPLLLCVLLLLVILFLLRRHRVRFHNRVRWLDRLKLYCTLLHDVRVCICIYLPCTSAAAAALLCVAILLLLQFLVIVRRMAKFVSVVPGFCVQCFVSLHSYTIYVQCAYVPLGSTVVFTASIFAYNTSHTCSVITGMRGAKAGIRPPRRSPPCNTLIFFTRVPWALVNPLTFFFLFPPGILDKETKTGQLAGKKYNTPHPSVNASAGAHRTRVQNFNL